MPERKQAFTQPHWVDVLTPRVIAALNVAVAGQLEFPEDLPPPKERSQAETLGSSVAADSVPAIAAGAISAANVAVGNGPAIVASGPDRAVVTSPVAVPAFGNAPVPTPAAVPTAATEPTATTGVSPVTIKTDTKTKALKAVEVRIADEYTIRYTRDTKTLELFSRSDPSATPLLRAARGADGNWEDRGSRLTAELVRKISADLEQFTAQQPKTDFDLERDLSAETQQARAQIAGDALLDFASWSAGESFQAIRFEDLERLPPEIAGEIRKGRFEQVPDLDSETGEPLGYKLRVQTPQQTIAYDPRTRTLQAFANDAEGQPDRLFFEGQRDADGKWQISEDSVTTAADFQNIRDVLAPLPKPSFDLAVTARPTVQDLRAKDIIGAIDGGFVADIRQAQADGNLDGWRQKHPSLTLEVGEDGGQLQITGNHYVIRAREDDRVSVYERSEAEAGRLVAEANKVDGQWQPVPHSGFATARDVARLPSLDRQQRDRQLQQQQSIGAPTQQQEALATPAALVA